MPIAKKVAEKVVNDAILCVLIYNIGEETSLFYF